MPSMKLSLVSLVSLAVVLAACSGDPSSAPVASRDPASAAPRAPATPDAGTPSDPPLVHDVAGAVVDARGTPVEGRPLVVVDARGARTELVTDEGGAFHALDVALPYDVGVEAAPSGAIRAPVAYLGLRTDAPRIPLPERAEPIALAPSHTFRVVVFATCAHPPCTVQVATTSAHGSGVATVTSHGFVVVPVEHAFRTGRVRDTESAELDVLVTDDAGVSAYAYAAGMAVEPGVKSDVEVVPAAVGSGALALDGAGRGLDPAWSRRAAAWLALPSGATMAIGVAPGESLTTQVPFVPGARVAAGVWASGEDGAAAAEWSGPLALGTATVRLEPHPGVTVAQPTPGGTLTLRGTGMRWSPSPFAQTVTLTDAGGARDLVVHVGGGEPGLSLRRLARLGVALPPLGAHTLDLRSWDGVSVDDLASAASLAAMRAGYTDQRVAFVVTR